MKIFFLNVIILTFFSLQSQNVSLDSLLGKTYEEIDSVFVVKTEQKPDVSNFPEFHSTYLGFKNSGLELLFEKNLLTTIFIYMQERDGYSVYNMNCTLAMEIEKLEVRKDVLKKMGKPGFSNGEKSRFPWDKYDMGKYFIHFEYDEENNLKMITLMINKDSYSD